MPILHQFGWYAAVGMVFAYIAVLLIVPIALSWTSEEKGKFAASAFENTGEKTIRSLARFSIRNPWPILCATGVFAAGCIAVGLNVNLDNRLTSLLKETHPTAVANEVIDGELGGVLTLELDLQSTVAEGQLLFPLDPSVVQALDQFERLDGEPVQDGHELRYLHPDCSEGSVG